MRRDELQAFLERHGGIEVAGDSDEGPFYTTPDGWTVWLPLDSPDVAEVRGPVCPTCGWRHTHDEGGYCAFKNSWAGWNSE